MTMLTSNLNIDGLTTTIVFYNHLCIALVMSYTALKVKDVHSGVIHKVGGRVKSWHKRWMVLKSDHTLQYFKDASKAPLGTISLQDPQFAVRKGEKSDFNWPKQCNLEHSLVIMTTGRVYYMFAESLDEAEEWKRQIKESKDKVEAKETGWLVYI